MQLINLDSIPNQSFSTYIDGVPYSITLRTAQGATLVTIESGGEALITNALCVPGENLLSYNSRRKKGNFRFVCQNDEYPYYENFGKNCFLTYVPEEEL